MTMYSEIEQNYFHGVIRQNCCMWRSENPHVIVEAGQVGWHVVSRRRCYMPYTS